MAICKSVVFEVKGKTTPQRPPEPPDRHQTDAVDWYIIGVAAIMVICTVGLVITLLTGTGTKTQKTNHMEEKKFEQWCLVELMGHQKTAGLCTEQTIGGANLLRVDVPQVGDIPAFTKFYSASAIYSITPVDEAIAREMARKFVQRPITAWELQEIINKMPMKLVGGDDVDEDDDEGF